MRRSITLIARRPSNVRALSKLNMTIGQLAVAVAVIASVRAAALAGDWDLGITGYVAWLLRPCWLG